MRAAAVVAAVVAALVTPALAHAHPRLVSSTPSEREVISDGTVGVVSLRFDEDADPVGAGITVTGPDGRDASRGPVEHHGRVLRRSVDARVRGTYVVEWLAVGDDTHPARGAFLFSVGEATRASAPRASGLGLVLQALGRWVSLFGYTLGFGVPFAAAVSGGVMTARLWRFVGVGIALMAVAEPLSLLGQTATLAPSHPFSSRLAGDVLLTSYGHVTGLRLGAALALWAVVGAVRRASPRGLWAIPALGALVALVHADAAHRIAGLPSVVSFVVVAAHVVAAGAWLGCIVVAVAGPAGVERRLAPYAGAGALLAVASGIGLAVGHVRSVHAFVDSAYGIGVVTKIAVVAVALVFAVTRRRRVELVAALAALAVATALVSLLPPV